MRISFIIVLGILFVFLVSAESDYDLEFSGDARPGSTVAFTINKPQYANNNYILMFAVGHDTTLVNGTGYNLSDGRVIPLNSSVHSGLFESIYNPRSVGLNNSQGTLDNNGQATVTWDIPNIPALVETLVTFTYVVVDYNKPMPEAILNISNTRITLCISYDGCAIG